MVKRFLASLPGVGAALLPSVTCPACLPVYAGVLSSLGLGAFVTGPYYFAIVIVLLGISLFSLGYQAAARRGYLPFVCGCIAATLLLCNKWLVGPRAIDFVGAGLLIAASIWNNWPKRMEPTDSETDQCCKKCR